MKITADTNVLLRAVVGDDEVQQQMTIATGWVVKTFVVFDKRAVSLVRQQGQQAGLLA